MKVKIAYATPNPRRKAEVDLIREFCGQAGFKVVDGGTNTFFGGALVRSEFDVALFAVPALLATADNVEGVQYNPSASGVTFNVNDWTLKQ